MGVKYEECWENTVRAFSLLVFAECGTSHFLALVGDVYVIFEIWRKFSVFPLTPQQSLFFSFWKKPPKISVALTTSDHECQNMLWFLSFFFFSFFLFFVPASLSGAFAPSAWNSSGHREAAGLSFVSSNHSYWFGVWSNYGSFVLGRGRAGCMEGWPVCGSQGLCSLPTALVTFHSWRKLSLEHWFTENVAFCWVQVDDSSCWSGRARGKCWFS